MATALGFASDVSSAPYSLLLNFDAKVWRQTDKMRQQDGAKHNYISNSSLDSNIFFTTLASDNALNGLDSAN